MMGISSPVRWYPVLVIRHIAVRCRRNSAPIIGSSLVIRRERFQDLCDPSAKAYGTAADPGRVISFECLLQWFAEHLLVADSRQPVRRCRGEIVTSAEATALNKWSDAELL